MGYLNILVVSDLHVGTTQEDERETKLIVNGQTNIFGQSLIEYLKGMAKNVDLLLCTGDIGNKGCNVTVDLDWRPV